MTITRSIGRAANSLVTALKKISKPVVATVIRDTANGDNSVGKTIADAIERTCEAVAKTWCQIMHAAPMWPIHGYYRCRVCHRQYPVPWEERPSESWPADTSSLDTPCALRCDRLNLERGHAVRPWPVPVTAQDALRRADDCLEPRGLPPSRGTINRRQCGRSHR